MPVVPVVGSERQSGGGDDRVTSESSPQQGRRLRGDKVSGRVETEAITERVEKTMGPRKRGFILVHIGTNNADRKGTTDNN